MGVYWSLVVIVNNVSVIFSQLLYLVLEHVFRNGFDELLFLLFFEQVLALDDGGQV